jgi:hypothetical protein
LAKISQSSFKFQRIYAFPDQDLAIILQYVGVGAQASVDGFFTREECFAIGIPNSPITAPVGPNFGTLEDEAFIRHVD